MSDRQIHLSNKKNRNAQVGYKGFVPKKQVLYVDSKNAPTTTRKYIKHTLAESYENLLKNHDDDPNQVAQAIVDGDPELNLEILGRFMTQSPRVYLNEEQEIVFQISKQEFVYNPQGEQIEAREPRYLEANINLEKPLMWSGKTFPIKDIYNQFVFTRKYQLMHTDGLTFDMLFDIAKELHESESMMLIGSGKGTGPVIFQDGGTPFRVFLEGRVKDDKYLLLMHLSNLELKPLPES